jgi:hypothetical protein
MILKDPGRREQLDQALRRAGAGPVQKHLGERVAMPTLATERKPGKVAMRPAVL